MITLIRILSAPGDSWGVWKRPTRTTAWNWEELRFQERSLGHHPQAERQQPLTAPWGSHLARKCSRERTACCPCPYPSLPAGNRKGNTLLPSADPTTTSGLAALQFLETVPSKTAPALAGHPQSMLSTSVLPPRSPSHLTLPSPRAFLQAVVPAPSLRTQGEVPPRPQLPHPLPRSQAQRQRQRSSTWWSLYPSQSAAAETARGAIPCPSFSRVSMSSAALPCLTARFRG